MSFWSGETLAARLPGLVEPFEESKIDCAAYTLQVGPEVYVSPSIVDDASTTKVRLRKGQSFAIPAGQFAFLLTEERIRVPSSALAFISIKARIKFKGLVNVSGFHVDPGYEGRLIFSVFNAGPAPVHLARGDDCFLMWFASLDVPSEEIKKMPGFDAIPSSLINPIAGEIQSFAGLLEKIRSTEKRIDVIDKAQSKINPILLEKIRWVIVTPIFAAFLVLAIMLGFRACDAPPTVLQIVPVGGSLPQLSDPGPSSASQPGAPVAAPPQGEAPPDQSVAAP